MGKYSRKTITSLSIAALSLSVSTGCEQQGLPTASGPPAPVRGPALIEYSDHFYPGADGYYWWDGQPPPGDLAPAEIISATAGGYAPRHGTGGWVAGNLTYIGHQYKMDLVYSVNYLGSPYYSSANASSGWSWSWNFPSNQSTVRYERSLGLDPVCGYSLENGGTAYARKAIPFGIDLAFLKYSIALTLGQTTWGQVDSPMQAFSDPGYSCDLPAPTSDCDLAGTPQIEYCPVPDDPANEPGGGGGGGDPTDIRGNYGGYSAPGGYAGGVWNCVDWIDWFASWDGRRTWKYLGRECTQYAD